MADATPLHLSMVAGEASGDLLAALMLQGLRQRWPGLRSDGIGGARMQQQGFNSDWPMERLSVFGYVDALKRLPELLRMRRLLGDRLLRDRPAAFIGVDAPDFNFGLEQRLRQSGIRTVHFVCPSIWAWRKERVHRLARAADHVLCLFPFEPALLHSHGIAATYVGHPLADLIPLRADRDAARRALGLSPGRVWVAVLPGSRRSEVAHIGPRFAQAAARMCGARRDIGFIVPCAPGLRSEIQAQWSSASVEAALFDGRSHEALAACDVALVASGTATLEAALFKRPMVIAYHLSWLNWQRMRRMSLQPWVGLPNILSRQFLVPELIQDAATPVALAEATLGWLDAPQRVRDLEFRFEAMHHELRQDTARKAADAIAQVIAR